jgi:putative heme-binding domain-containing protein
MAFPPAKFDPKKLPDIARLAKLRGSAEHGKQSLAANVKNDLQCLKCHTIGGVGGQIGPDLSTIGKKASRETLFESIINPSKAVAEQHVTWSIVTKDGKSISGLLIEETPGHGFIRDANGKDTKIEKKEIDAREKDPNSLMPDNLLAYMTEEDLLDMVEYLLTLNQDAGVSQKK